MINDITDYFRRGFIPIARSLDKISGGRITPNFITAVSLLGHIPVFWAIATEQFVLGALLLAFFGLMDALDGALANVQGKSSPKGMLYDASSDRAKEILIYAGLIYVFAGNENMVGAMASIAALGGSFMVSYIKAKGETALATSAKNHKQANRQLAFGFMQYQVRMLLLVIGLLLNVLTIVVSLIAVLSWLTALTRLIDVSEQIE